MFFIEETKSALFIIIEKKVTNQKNKINTSNFVFNQTPLKKTCPPTTIMKIIYITISESMYKKIYKFSEDGINLRTNCSKGRYKNKKIINLPIKV